MAVEKDLVIAALKELKKTSGHNYTDKLISDVAADLAPLIESEDKISETIESPIAKALLKSTAAEGDRRVTQYQQTEAARKKAEDASTGQPVKEGAKADEGDPLAKALAALNERLDRMEKGATAKSLQERFRQDPRLKDFPEKLFKGRYPETEEAFEEAAAEMAKDFADYATFQAQQGDGTSGTKGTTPQGNVKQPVAATKEELDRVPLN